MQISSDHGGEAGTPAGRHLTASLGRVARRAVPSLLVSAVGPAVCFIAGRQLWGLVGGVVLALLWNGAAQALRILRVRSYSGILAVGLVGLVTRGTLALALNSARMYFIAPAVVTAVTGAVYVCSAFTDTPLVCRMFCELVPRSVVDPESPKWRRALRRGTILYGTEQMGVAVLSLLLVARVGPTTYAAVHPVLSSAVFALAALAAIPFLRPDRIRGSARPACSGPGADRGIPTGAVIAGPAIAGAAPA